MLCFQENLKLYYGISPYRFSRTIRGSDLKQDLDLNDGYYLLFGHGQTPRGIIYNYTAL